ncbi:unnamed protein product [Ophioblennius macclurei]
MAEEEQEKSHGLKFAEQQLLRHGWEQGKGLGRAGNGISEAIKVKVKCDKGGVGHREGDQFSFHWWDHVFNKASSSLQVESDNNGTKLKKMVEEEEEEGQSISSRKPRRAAPEKSKLYGCFVKSATLRGGREQPEQQTDSGSSSSDEETLDLSSTTRLSDSDLMKVCGGRTAHKGARHGLTMSAKLARLERQEAEFMARYSRTGQSEERTPVCDPQEEKERVEDESEENTQKKRKRKKKKADKESQWSPPEVEKEEKKKKKRRSKPAEEEQKVNVKTKRKKCKKDKMDEEKSRE